MSNYLVTGAAGFIGARTAELLLERGHSVVGIDNLNDYYDPALKHYRLNTLRRFPAFSFQNVDIEDQPAVRNLFVGTTTQPFDCVFNLAARAGVRASLADPFVYFSTNLTGTLNLLECMRESGVRKMVLASTSSLYAGSEMPFVETSEVNRPLSPYAASKKSAEVLAYTYHHLYGIDVSVVRYFTVFGPAGRPDMMPFRFVARVLSGQTLTLYGDGSASRDFTYVDDIAEGTIAAAVPVGYEIFNLGGGKRPVTVSSIIRMIEQKTSRSAVLDVQPRQAVDMDSTWADISKAQRVLGWLPKVDVEEGFARTIEWHLQNRNLVDSLDVSLG